MTTETDAAVIVERVAFIVDEPDGVAVGVRVTLPNGDIVWSGDISGVLWRSQDAEAREALRDEYGHFVIHGGQNGVEVVARAASTDLAIDLAQAYAAWLRDAKHV